MKFKKEEIRQLRKNFIDTEAWLKVRKKAKEIKCPECSRKYVDIDHEKIAFILVEGKGNQHLCNDCADKYVAMGIEDIDVKVRTQTEKKRTLIEELEGLYNLTLPRNLRKPEELSIETLEKAIATRKREIEHREFIDSIDSSEWILEEYLVKQYGVLMDAKYLKDVSQFEDYFKDMGYEYLDCGQGYYNDEVVKLVCLGEKFYEVTITAEIGSSKQDRGDRLYWVETIESVTWREIEKPVEKKVQERVYKLNLTDDQDLELKVFIEKLTE